MTRKSARVCLAALCGLLFVAASGCASPAANRVEVVPQGTASIVIDNGGLQDEVEVVSGHALYEDEILIGVVNLRSHVDEKMTLMYRWSWRDADGIDLETQSGDYWRTVFVNALEEKQVTGRATAPGATKGIFELRYHSGYETDE